MLTYWQAIQIHCWESVWRWCECCLRICEPLHELSLREQIASENHYFQTASFLPGKFFFLLNIGDSSKLGKVSKCWFNSKQTDLFSLDIPHSEQPSQCLLVCIRSRCISYVTAKEQKQLAHKSLGLKTFNFSLEMEVARLQKLEEILSVHR